jgi:hypothetical protein
VFGVPRIQKAMNPTSLQIQRDSRLDQREISAEINESGLGQGNIKLFPGRSVLLPRSFSSSRCERTTRRIGSVFAPIEYDINTYTSHDGSLWVRQWPESPTVFRPRKSWGRELPSNNSDLRQAQARLTPSSAHWKMWPPEGVTYSPR